MSANTWYEVDVTSIVTGDGTYSFRISDSVGGADYSSKEGANDPELVLTLGGTPVATNTPTNTPTPGPSPTPTNTSVPTATATTPPSAPFNNATFLYDGDGKRVKSTFNGTTTTYFVGNHYEVTGSTITKYYYAGGQRIAMRTNSTLNYLLGDHLGSTSLTTDANGQVVSELRYTAWGETRYSSGPPVTQYQYTGQYSHVSDFGLIFYNARWLDVSLGRFAQADTIIPGPRNSQAWDRYAYSLNDPIKYTDPSGHLPCLSCSIQAFVMVLLNFSDINNTPAITAPRSSVPSGPAENTTWLIDQLNTNAASEFTQEMNSQIAQASTLGGSGFVTATKMWVSLTQKDAIWDFKHDIRLNPDSFRLPNSRNVHLGDGFETHFEALANIHYGYVGSAAGFSSIYLQAGAGLKQKETERGPITTYLDDPYDNYWIRFGIFLYKEYGSEGLTEDEFNSALHDFLEKHGAPGDPLGVKNKMQ